MSGTEKITSDEPKAPIAIPRALPIKVREWEKTSEMTKNPEKKDTPPQKTDIEIKKEVLWVTKWELQKKRNVAKEVAEGKKTYQDDVSAFEWWDSPWIIPPRPDQKMVKKEDFERSEKELHEQENKTAEAIKWKMDAELESVTKTGKIDQIDPVLQKKIRTEVIMTSIDAQLLPDEKKKGILSTMKWADGKLIDLSKVNFKQLTEFQKDFILHSNSIQKIASDGVEEYKKLQNEAQKTWKKLDPESSKKLQSQLGLPNAEALELSQIRPGIKLADYPTDTQIGIIQRTLAQSTFQDLQTTLSDGLQWSHIPDSLKREIVTDSFQYDPLKNSKAVEQAISDAKTAATNGKKIGESDVQFASRLKEKIGVKNADLQALSLEARKTWLSSGMRMLADFFGPIGAALGMPFWQEYMGVRRWSDDDLSNNGSDRWTNDSKGWKAIISQWVVRSNKNYLDSGKGLKLDGWSYEQQASSASSAISANKERYMRVAEKTGIPWELIGAIHFRESSLDFSKCLHNGDPLGQKTTSVPAGRWPFSTWEESAIDALNMKWQLGFWQITQTNQLEQVAWYAEKYNGFGYRNKWVSSAYVWAGTEAYTWGMYVADHVFSHTKKDPRPWVMAIISKLIPTSVIAEKRSPDTSHIAATAGAFEQEFTSSPFERSSTWTTLCSRTGRNNLSKILDRSEDIPSGNAIDVHEIYQSWATFDGMVGGYSSSWSPPENANVADIFLKTSSPYGHRVAAYRWPRGWMILDPYYGGKWTVPQPVEEYSKKNNIAWVAFYQKSTSVVTANH